MTFTLQADVCLDTLRGQSGTSFYRAGTRESAESQSRVTRGLLHESSEGLAVLGARRISARRASQEDFSGSSSFSEES